MNRIDKLNKIQQSAIDALEQNNFKGTLIMSVRTGKTLTFIKALYRMLDLNLISKGDTIRFWSKYVTATHKMLEDEEQASLKILGKNPFKDFNFIFKSAQSGIKGVEDIAQVECYDEVDSLISALYSKVITDSLCKYKIGLTGTINRTSNVFLSKIDDDMKGKVRQTIKETEQGLITDRINKGQMLDIILPVIYQFTIPDAIKEGIINSFETIILEHTLGTKDKYLIPRGWKNKMSEYEYYQNRESSRRNFKTPMYLRGLAGKDQTELLYTMKSKIIVVNKLLSLLKGKTVIFNIRKKSLYEITDNVCESKNTIELIEDFRTGKINVLASAKMISRVISLPGIDNVILMSYYTKNAELLQSLGRSLLYKKGKVPQVYIFRTVGTREEMWYDKVTDIVDNSGKVLEKFDMNVKRILSTRALFLKDFKL